MNPGWTILHGGALGDLVLTLQLALRLPHAADGLHVISRTDPGDLSACQPSITRRSAEGLGLHWLYSDVGPAGNAANDHVGPICNRSQPTANNHVGPVCNRSTPTGGDESPPAVLRDAIAGQRVLNFLGDSDSVVHRRLAMLDPAELHSVDPRSQRSSVRHIARQWQGQIKTPQLSIAPKRKGRRATPVLHVPDSLRDKGRTRLASYHGSAANESDIVVVHPGSGGRSKCWPLPSYLACGELLRNLFGVVFVLGPVELETWRETAIQAVEATGPTIRAPSPDELAALLAGANAFIGNDAGAAHLAALLGTPTVAVFGPTNPRVWRPLGPYVEVVAGDPLRSEDWGVSALDVVRPVVELIKRRNLDAIRGRT